MQFILMLIHYEYNYYHTSDEAVRPRQGKGGYSTTLEKEKKAESAGAMKHSSNHAATEDGLCIIVLRQYTLRSRR
jgi:hypothetical protein